jgi:hypothetical protein
MVCGATGIDLHGKPGVAVKVLEDGLPRKWRNPVMHAPYLGGGGGDGESEPALVVRLVKRCG